MEVENQDPVFGRALILAYLRGNTDAVVAYGKFCHALQSFDQATEEAKGKYLTQLSEMGECLNENCLQLIKAIVKIPWSSIPDSFRSNFQRLLLEMALHNTANIELVYEACVRNFRPQPGHAYVNEEMDRQLKLAHSLISQILRCVPVSAQVLYKMIEKFPHHTLDTEAYTWHFRSVILVGEYATQLRPMIWDVLIQKLLVLDSYVTQKRKDKDNKEMEEERNIFDLDETIVDQSDTEQNPVTNQSESLDCCMLAIYQYISIKMGHPVEDAPWLRVGANNDVFEILSKPFDLHLLMTPDANVVPFIWLYLCSFDPKYSTQFFENLWHRIIQPQRAQSDAKRGQNAASFLAAFLARAQYVDVDESFDWLNRIRKWLIAYIDAQNGVSSISIQPGAPRHGTFYSMCQAFFIIFCFRYKRIYSNVEKWEQISRWNLSRIVNSQLDPLKYVSRPVAVCFSTIARSLQLVYCAHQLAIYNWEASNETVFEFSFPLDSYNLPRTSALITPFVRRFAPLKEDLPILKEEFAKAKKDLINKISDAGDSSLDFMDEEEEAMLIGSPMYTISGFPMTIESSSRVPHQFSSYYSTSPGLKAFDYNQAVNNNRISGMR